jgi:short chain dehydrogenase
MPNRGGHTTLARELFGPLHVTQAVLPVLRAQGHGHIIQISTVGGVASFPIFGGYHPSKWALEGLTESLAQEVAGFGFKVTLVEPAGYATDWGGASAKWAEALPAYQKIKEAMFVTGGGLQNNPAGVGPAILAVADAVGSSLPSLLRDPGPATHRAALCRAPEDLARHAGHLRPRREQLIHEPPFEKGPDHVSNHRHYRCQRRHRRRSRAQASPGRPPRRRRRTLAAKDPGDRTGIQAAPCCRPPSHQQQLRRNHLHERT